MGARAIATVTERPGSRSLVERELLHSLEWLISLRWYAGLAVLLVTPLAAALFKVHLPVAGLVEIGVAILVYNVLLLLALRQMRRTDPENTPRFERFARVQIALDWIAMAVLISYSGGAESPAIIFFLFHIAIASLLLPHNLGLLYVSIAPALVAAVAALEYTGRLRHVAVIQTARYDDPVFVTAVLGFFAIACYGMAYCCMAIARRLRRRESELGSLYDGVRDITSTLEIDTVLDRIAEAAARVLHCKAAAIRLIDTSGASVEFAASFGLSEAYRDEVPAEFARSRLDQDTLREGVVHVLDVESDPRVWQAARVRDEGIASMLSAAIHGRSGAMGVLRAYGAPGQRFSDEDVAYLRTLAAQGAIAIEHAKAYRLLADLDIDKSRFLRLTTHELRSPVRVTESLLMTLAEGYAGALGPEQAELVGRAQRRLASLHALIDDLLDLAAGKASMNSPQRAVIDLCAVAAEVVERFRPVAGEKQIALELLSPAERLDVFCDPADLERIVGNLVSNAVKYTPRGHVTVTLSAEHGHARLVVTDTGIGIPQASMQHLFGEFYRAPNARAVEESGTGLGLSIVKLLAERAGGRVAVDSHEGIGTTFSIEMPHVGRSGGLTFTHARTFWVRRSVPLCETRLHFNHEAAHAFPIPRVQGAHHMARILVVDDDPDIRYAVSLCLRQHGYEVQTASNRAEGMAAIAALAPDLLVLDVMMELPDDGLAMAQELRRTGVRLPIVMLTSVGKVTGMEFDQQSELVPVDAFFEKPVRPEDLLRCLEELLARQGA